MKKLLLIILIAFIIVSILTIMFTFQASSTFSNFIGDDGDNGDVYFSFSNLNILQDVAVNKIKNILLTDNKNVVPQIFNLKLSYVFSVFLNDII